MVKYLPLLLLLCAVATFDCATKKAAVDAAPAPTYAGNWNVAIVGTPLGDVRGTLSLEAAADGSYDGQFAANGATYELRSATATEDGVRAIFYFADYGVDVQIDLEGEPTGPLAGVTNNEYPTTAQREE